MLGVARVVFAQSAATSVDLHEVLVLDRSIQGSFVQRRSVAGVEATFVSSGTFLVVHGDGLLWQVASPSPLMVAFTPRGTRTYDDAGNPSDLDSGMPRQMSRMIQDMMDLSILSDRRFESVASGDEAAWTLVLSPKRRSIERHLKQVKLRGDEFIRSIDILGGDGSETHLEFTDLKVVDTLTSGQCTALGLREASCVPGPKAEM
jgi:hypothetical protein